jgi:hypothetical protein
VKEVDNSIEPSAKRHPLELGFYLALDMCAAATSFFLGFMAATQFLPELSIVHFHHWLHLNNIASVAMTSASRWILPLFWLAWFVILMLLLRRFPEMKSRIALEIKEYYTHSKRLSSIGLGSFAAGALFGILVLI